MRSRLRKSPHLHRASSTTAAALQIVAEANVSCRQLGPTIAIVRSAAEERRSINPRWSAAASTNAGSWGVGSRPVADLIISRLAPGVARVRSADPFDVLEIHRIERARWAATPERPGIYLLHGISPEGKVIVYLGMSTANMRSRIRSHHVNPAKNWFGVLFAIPLGSALLCPAIEAELIAELSEAGTVDVIANVADETRMRDSDDVHVGPAVEKIKDALQLLLGADIFTQADVKDQTAIDLPLEKPTQLNRVYKGRVSEARPRQDGVDPEHATHRWLGLGLRAWGRFEGDEPDTHFKVFASSEWRAATPNPDAANFPAMQRVLDDQKKLIAAGVLTDDNVPGTFVRDHTFENWSTAARIVGGRATSSGAYRWQRLS